MTETIGPAKPKIFIIWPFTEKVGRLLTSYPYSQTRKKKSTQIWKFTYLTSLAQGQVWAALTAPCVKARPLSSAAAAEAGVHPAPQRCHPPQVPVRPGPRCTLAAPTGPPWTPSTASSPPTQETAPGSSPTFNPRVPSSSSTSHRRGSGCPYSTPCAPSSVRAGGWQCPGVEDTNPPPGAQRSCRPADSLAVTGLPPERPRSEKQHRSPQQLEGPLGRHSLLAAVSHAGGELGGSLHLPETQKLVTSAKAGLDARVCYQLPWDESTRRSPNPTGPGTCEGKAGFSPCASPPLSPGRVRAPREGRRWNAGCDPLGNAEPGNCEG